MYPVKQSTALDGVFFAHDANGDAVTGMVDGGFTKRISKNGAAFIVMTVTITERENGWYHYQLSTSHTDTLGILSVTFINASMKQVNLQWRVHANILDDLSTHSAADVWAAVTRTLTAADNITSTGGTTVPQTGDSFARLGAPAGASVSADVAAVKVDSAAILVDTADIQPKIGTPAADVSADIAAVQADTDNIQTRIPAALVAGRIDASVGAMTANVLDAAALAADAGTEIANAVLDLTDGIETSRTVREALRIILASAAGKLAGAATTTVTIRDTNDTVNRITATVDADGNRSAVTLDDT